MFFVYIVAFVLSAAKVYQKKIISKFIFVKITNNALFRLILQRILLKTIYIAELSQVDYIHKKKA